MKFTECIFNNADIDRDRFHCVLQVCFYQIMIYNIFNVNFFMELEYSVDHDFAEEVRLFRCMENPLNVSEDDDKNLA